MTAYREEAERLVIEIYANCDYKMDHRINLVGPIARALSAAATKAEADGYAKGVEAAAKVVDSVGALPGSNYDCLAKKIRALVPTGEGCEHGRRMTYRGYVLCRDCEARTTDGKTWEKAK